MEVARSQSFAETPHAQPLPLPGVHHAGVGRSSSGIGVSRRPGLGRGSEPLDLPLPRPGCVSNRLDHAYIEGDIATASILVTATNSPSRRVSVSAFEDQSPIVIQKNSKEVLKPADFSLNNHIPSTSPRWALLSTHVQNSQMPYRGLGSGHCSSPGSGHNSGHNSIGGDIESGEMCAMKEVTLFADDPKSKESAKQLVQEIALLSRLRHPNIVHYYGFEMEFGQFGEMAIHYWAVLSTIIQGKPLLDAPEVIRNSNGCTLAVDR
ncbi:hypothetical protein GH714_003971 [Hevea brasiliensis]|uniref:Protein kinase domain-containing protein n=1 Tax=Hevea brasiliensis TaxID=3981 RepID=A0A6A6LBJ3_HEVBR|nr:hypothetical protein GH714_003971 [Hevea brasiliensis]